MFRKGDIEAFVCAAALTLFIPILMRMAEYSPAKGSLELITVIFLTPYGSALFIFALARLHRERKNAKVNLTSWTWYLILSIVILLAVIAVKVVASIFIMTVGPLGEV